jgi:hypothetical protein
MRSINPFDGAVDIPTVASEGFFALVQDPSERWEETDIAATTENYRTHTDGHNAATGNHPNQQSGFNSLGGETNIQSNSNSVFLFEDYLYFPDDVDIGSRTQSPVHDCNPAEALPDVIDGCFQGTDQLSASGEARGNTRQRASVNSPTFLATASTASVTFMAIASSNNEATETEGMALDAPTPKEPQSPATPQPPDNDDLYDLDDIGQLSPPLKPMKVTLQPSPSPSPAVRLPRYKGISKGDSVLISFMSGGKHLQTPSSTRPSGESAAVPDEDDIPELDISHPVAQPILSGTEQGESSKAESNIPRSQLFYEPPVYICPFCTDRDHKYPRPANLQR